MAWILICKRCKSGEKICYNSTHIEFFLEDYFFDAPRICYYNNTSLAKGSLIGRQPRPTYMLINIALLIYTAA